MRNKKKNVLCGLPKAIPFQEEHWAPHMFNQGKQAVTMVTTTAWHKRKANRAWVEVLGMNRNDCQVKGQDQLLLHWIILEQNHRPSITFIANGLTISLVSSKLYALMTNDGGTPHSFRCSLCPSSKPSVSQIISDYGKHNTKQYTVIHPIVWGIPILSQWILASPNCVYSNTNDINKLLFKLVGGISLFSPSDNSRISGSLHFELHKM